MNEFAPVHHDLIVRLEEQLAFQQTEIQQLSDEMYAQQKEMMGLYARLHRLEQKLQSLSEGSVIRDVADETPPPHY